MAKFIIASQWIMVAETEVEANSLQEAIDLISNSDIPDGEYLDDSFEINKEVTEMCNKDVL